MTDDEINQLMRYYIMDNLSIHIDKIDIIRSLLRVQVKLKLAGSVISQDYIDIDGLQDS